MHMATKISQDLRGYSEVLLYATFQDQAPKMDPPAKIKIFCHPYQQGLLSKPQSLGRIAVEGGPAGSQTMECFIGKNQNLEFNTEMNEKPVWGEKSPWSPW